MDISRIMQLTPEEVSAVVQLQKLANEANEVAQLIKETYRCFGISEEQIEVWQDRDGYNHEYLTHNGIWQARYLHQTYDVSCTPEGIFDCFKAEYFKQMGVCNLSLQTRELAEAAEYFRSFINKTRRMAEAKAQSSSAFQG